LTSLDISNNQLVGKTRGNQKEKPSWWDESKHGGAYGWSDDHYDIIPDMDGIIAIANAIKDMGALATLVLKDNKLLTPEAGKVLSDMLAANTVLKELDVSGNNWAEHGLMKGDGPGFAKELAVGISGNGALSSLNLSLNDIGGHLTAMVHSLLHQKVHV
jgi:hypothetical protein